MLPLAGAPALARMCERVGRSRYLDGLVVATTVAPPDRVIADLCARIACPCHRGPVDDITTRLLEAAAAMDADVLVQLTGDCPLVDPAMIDDALTQLLETGADYASGALPRPDQGGGFPLGLEVRALRVAALRRSAELSDDPIDRVHGSYFIHRRPDLFRHVACHAPPLLRRPELRLTVDEPADYELVRRIFDGLYPVNPAFGAAEIIALLDRHPDWLRLNAAVTQKTPEQG
jgi:spore coat polysaccharide biosynthesis protein SpsF